MDLRLEGLTLRYGRPSAPAAVDDVSLQLGAGRIGVLIGPSGCGKTSLLRAVAGLEHATAGRIALGDRVLDDAARGTRIAPEHRRIGMVFQDYALFPHLSVARNIAYGLAHQRTAQRHERVDAMLELVGLQGMGTRLPHELSGGQQQRVALARALAPAPQLLLMDEPFSSLDVELRERLAGDVRQILVDSGTTALVVTHDPHEAFALADAIGVMQAGRLEQWADAYAIYHRPATRFVARFVGQGVFAPARIVADDGVPRVMTAVGRLGPPASGIAADPSESSPPFDVLLRADDIVHDDASPMKARIVRKAFRGAQFLYTLALDDGTQVLALVPSHHDHAPGESIGIRVEVDHVVTFAREPLAS